MHSSALRTPAACQTIPSTAAGRGGACAASAPLPAPRPRRLWRPGWPGPKAAEQQGPVRAVQDAADHAGPCRSPRRSTALGRCSAGGVSAGGVGRCLLSSQGAGTGAAAVQPQPTRSARACVVLSRPSGAILLALTAEAAGGSVRRRRRCAVVRLQPAASKRQHSQGGLTRPPAGVCDRMQALHRAMTQCRPMLGGSCVGAEPRRALTASARHGCPAAAAAAPQPHVQAAQPLAPRRAAQLTASSQTRAPSGGGAQQHGGHAQRAQDAAKEEERGSSGSALEIRQRPISTPVPPARRRDKAGWGARAHGQAAPAGRDTGGGRLHERCGRQAGRTSCRAAGALTVLSQEEEEDGCRERELGRQESAGVRGRRGWEALAYTTSMPPPMSPPPTPAHPTMPWPNPRMAVGQKKAATCGGGGGDA